MFVCLCVLGGKGELRFIPIKEVPEECRTSATSDTSDMCKHDAKKKRKKNSKRPFSSGNHLHHHYGTKAKKARLHEHTI